MKKILRTALAILVVSAISATFTACGPEEPNDNIPVDTPAVGDAVTTAPEVGSQPVDSSLPEITSVVETSDPNAIAPVATPPVTTEPEVTTASTPAETEKTTEKTEKATEKTEKKTEKTEKTQKTEKTTEATKDTEPEEGSRLPDDEDSEDIDLEWEEVNPDEWLDIIGEDGEGEEIEDIGVKE